MTMLRNEKAILVYGLANEEIKKFQSLGIKVITITNEMIDMKIKNILSGLRFEIVTTDKYNEKIILFNDLTDEEVKFMVSATKSIVQNPILAVVTSTSKEWEFKKLIKHLIEEKEWHNTR